MFSAQLPLRNIGYRLLHTISPYIGNDNKHPSKMSLTLQQINADATFVITLGLPRLSPASVPETSSSFSILVDPWLHSDAPVFHPRFSNQIHTVAPAINSLAELSPSADLIVISQSKSDHCHEGTLKEYKWSENPNTQLYACPDAASIIKGWKWFPQTQMRAFKKGEVVRIEIPNPQNPALRAWVELEYIPARWLWEMPNLHSAIGIKYFFTEVPSSTKMISVLFTPHGLPISSLRPWLSRLPGKRPQLSLLLHPLTHVHSYMGGEISCGFPAGKDICKVVNVGVWVSTHDEEKLVEGFVASRITMTKWNRQKAEEDLSADGIDNVSVKELGVLEPFKISDGVVIDA